MKLPVETNGFRNKNFRLEVMIDSRGSGRDVLVIRETDRERLKADVAAEGSNSGVLRTGADVAIKKIIGCKIVSKSIRRRPDL